MNIALVSLFPEMFEAVTRFGVTGRAFKKDLMRCKVFNPRDYTTDRHQTVDDRPYGGGPGMVMRVEPLLSAVAAAKQWLDQLESHLSQDAEHMVVEVANRAPKVVYLSPQGRPLDQRGVAQLQSYQHLVLVAGRYEGVDERFVEACVDEEWSIGDYVLSGGELPAMVVMDAVARLIPGVLGDPDSAQQDSFQQGLLDCPHYTRPEESPYGVVPPVLLSGDHGNIARWRLQQSVGRTWERRPELLQSLNSDEQALLEEYRAQRHKS